MPLRNKLQGKTQGESSSFQARQNGSRKRMQRQGIVFVPSGIRRFLAAGD
jgi:hypothetical protein